MRNSFQQMPATKPTKLLSKILLSALIIILLGAIGSAVYENFADYSIPESAKKLVNHIPSSDAVLKNIKPIYSEKCANCHGETGKGDGPDAHSHYPSASDLTDANRYSHFTDGELFYRITHGRKPMPAFKNRLPEDQRWQLVDLVRSFSQPSPKQNR